MFVTKRLQRLTALFGALLVAACASGPVGLDPGVSLANLDALPAPSTEDLGYNQAARIAEFDKLQITVFGVDELTRSERLDSSGAIDFPYVGKVAALGKTTEEVAQAIEQGLRQGYVRNPDVQVEIAETTARTVTIGGQVSAPGQFPIKDRLSLLEGVTLAGGLTQFAKLDDVLIMRTVNGQRYIGIYNLGAIQRGNYPDPNLYPRDVVVVGDSPLRRTLVQLSQFSPLLTTPVILLDRITR